MTAYFIVSWVCTAFLFFDGMRRSESEWVIADRSRSGWLGFGVPFGLIGLGPFCLLAYGIAVVPRFRRPGDGRARQSPGEHPFKKT